ncbi:hypothetical protein [Pedobacter mendelii]|uniref:Uncharacterized protein n=1 Tax=Pedobacter mendelii TaxID=1908240 RepID=A0ABQ2BIP6_9SPHI|nr:hypothetical protein [Pedobacter mendelii]GGI25350.1 hypothetical protein GCM10008119_17220 [Pedobacter mendelii]
MAPSIESGSNLKSTIPVAMALKGIFGKDEVYGFLTITIPPAFLTAISPSAPSFHSLESTKKVALLPQSTASELKKYL